MTTRKRQPIDPGRRLGFQAMDKLCDAISDVEGFVALLELLETHIPESADEKADAVTFLEPKMVQSAANLRGAFEHAHKAVFARKADAAR